LERKWWEKMAPSTAESLGRSFSRIQVESIGYYYVAEKMKQLTAISWPLIHDMAREEIKKSL